MLLPFLWQDHIVELGAGRRLRCSRYTTIHGFMKHHERTGERRDDNATSGNQDKLIYKSFRRIKLLPHPLNALPNVFSSPRPPQSHRNLPSAHTRTRRDTTLQTYEKEKEGNLER